MCASCQRRLSRYNPSTTCASCAQRHVPPLLSPAWLWDSEELRRALADVDLGAALSVIRAAVGLSQLEFATLLGWSQSGVARAESGQRDTLYDIRRLLEVADALDMPRAALVPVLVGLGSVADEGPQWEVTDDVILSRRQLGGVMVGLSASTGSRRMRIPATVDAAHVRHLHTSTERLYSRDQRIGSGSLKNDGLRLYLRSRRMLDEADYSESTARQLMGVVGELAVCVGWLCFDSNDHIAAREFYTEARLMADQSGDSGLAVRALEKMSLELVRTAREQGRPAHAREAVRLSRRAAEIASADTLPQLQALLAAREAIALAAIGDKPGFLRAIGRARHEIEKDSVQEVPVWLRFVNTSEIAVQEAKGYTYLGDPAAAVALYRNSLDGQLMSRNSANYRAQLAAALTANGDVAAALVEGAAVLPMLDDGHITSSRTLEMLREVRDAAAQHHRGHDFCARFDQAIGASA